MFLLSLLQKRVATRFSGLIGPRTIHASTRTASALGGALSSVARDAQGVLGLTRRSFGTSVQARFATAAAAATAKKPKSSAPPAKKGATAVKKKTATTTGTKAKPKVKAAGPTKGRAKPKPKPKRKLSAKKKPKPVVKKKKKVPKKKSRLPVTFRHDGPPKAPGNGWTIFYVEYLKSVEKMKHPSELPGRVRAASAKWKAMTEAEKQPYRDLHREQQKAHHLARMKYFDTVNPQVMRALNKRRRARGKQPYRRHASPEFTRPPGAFILYVADFRKSYEGQQIPYDPPTKYHLVTSRMAAEKWRTLSDTEKKPYLDEGRARMEAYKRRNAEHVKPLPAKK